jgi:hypothetical protein
MLFKSPRGKVLALRPTAREKTSRMMALNRSLRDIVYPNLV